MPLTATTYTPSRRARAVRSLRAVNQITEIEKRRHAFALHMTEFEPVIGCAVTSERVRPMEE